MTILLSIVFICASAQSNCDTIFWSATNKLRAADFKDFADTGKTMIAFTMAKLGYKAIPQDDGVLINTSSYFLPCRSWLNKQNTNSLQHEQLHFDIAEYHKRLFLKRISETSSSADIFPSAAKAIFRDVAEQRRTMDADYDKQTNTGQKNEEQKKWNSKIAALLNELEKYNTNVAEVKLK